MADFNRIWVSLLVSLIGKTLMLDPTKRKRPQYTVTSWLLFSFGTFDSFLAGPVRNQVYGTCSLLKPPMNQFKLVQQLRQQVLF